MIRNMRRPSCNAGRISAGLGGASLLLVVVLGCSDSADESTIPAHQDSGAADATADQGSGCVARTCAQAGADCGTAPDGCGGALSCGVCTEGFFCGGAGPNRCGAATCEPKTCAELGAACGDLSDQCDKVLSCGTCNAPAVCNGANQCVCDPASCTAGQCGPVPDGCGGALECGSCIPPQTCGGGGVASTCGCTPSCVAHDACGSNGCSGDCGACTKTGSHERYCRNGYCVWEIGNGIGIPCNETCGWGSSTCVGTSSGTCATKDVDGIRCYCW